MVAGEENKCISKVVCNGGAGSESSTAGVAGDGGAVASEAAAGPVEEPVSPTAQKGGLSSLHEVTVHLSLVLE